MRTNKDWRNARQGAFDLPDDRFAELSAGFDNWMVYKNANLSIHVTDKCNADCGFCVAHVRYANEGRIYAKAFQDSDDKYFASLDRALEALSTVNPSVSITGGEPTINSRLPRILDTLARRGVRKRTLTTNGTGLLETMEGKTVVEMLGDYQLEHLNISRTHHDEAKNAHLMRMNPDLMPEAVLKEAVAEAQRQGIKVRMSCVLLADGIEGLVEMEKYAEWALGKIGADSVIFRELMGLDKTKETRGSVPEYCDNQRVLLMPLWEEMDSREGFSREHQVLGYYYYVEVWNVHGKTWVSEAADIGMLAPQRKAHAKRFGMPIAFEMVFHPNGNLCAGWIEDEDIMVEDKVFMQEAA